MKLCLHCEDKEVIEGVDFCSDPCRDAWKLLHSMPEGWAEAIEPEYPPVNKKPALEPGRERPKVVRLVVVQTDEEIDTSILDEVQRPKTRKDCKDGPRPCPWVGCSHHLYLDVLDDGSIRFNHPNKGPEDLAETCALDVADREGATLEEVGRYVNLTRERVRQLIEGALKTARKNTNPMFKSSVDVEDPGSLSDPYHALGD